MSASARHVVASLFSLVILIAAAARADGVGEVAFANSGAATAQAPFLRGLALLHNFEYPDAAISFQQAQKADPGFAMAYWGEAMTHTHPVWMEQDREAARAVLQRLAPTAAERLAKAPTERERDYLRAVEVLYGEGTQAERTQSERTKEQRDVDYAGAMAALHEKYSDDVDATAFYALALLGTAHEGRDVPTYMRAAALLEEVFPAHPHHPGVLHYLIHCYDDAVHAPLGVRAARLYGAVAPDAGHALHMTSHIFIALGQWDDVIAANERAMAVVNQQRAAKGEPAKHCGHYVDWLFYGLLQTGRVEEADRELEQCRQDARAELVAAKPTDGHSMSAAGKAADARSMSAAAYHEMRLQRLADTGKLLADGVAAPDAKLGLARFTVAYADAYAAARGDAPAEQARAALDRLRAAQQAAGNWAGTRGSPDPVAAAAATVSVQQIEALLLLREGKRDEALAALAKAADAEDAIPLVFGPPVVEKPTRELLAEELLAAGKAAEAERAFEALLGRTPGRTLALQGLLRAQQALGEHEEAARTQAQLARNLHREVAAGAPR
ncbi:MAG TPA: hypothetical protein VGV61_18670 [Thermoanaerobaculia bacterium]|jgi:tetratricopeptide (TPR) repeat protein|nr:hypothetical protein [Thermoanaerobaculia bacterium]